MRSLTLSHMAPRASFCAWPGGHVTLHTKATLQEIKDDLGDVMGADWPVAIHRARN